MGVLLIYIYIYIYICIHSPLVRKAMGDADGGGFPSLPLLSVLCHNPFSCRQAGRWHDIVKDLSMLCNGSAHEFEGCSWRALRAVTDWLGEFEGCAWCVGISGLRGVDILCLVDAL